MSSLGKCYILDLLSVEEKEELDIRRRVSFNETEEELRDIIESFAKLYRKEACKRLAFRGAGSMESKARSFIENEAYVKYMPQYFQITT